MQNIFNRIIKISIYALTFLLPLFFLPFSFEVLEYNKQILLLFLVSLAFFAWLAKMVICDKEIRFRRSPLDIFVLVFIFAAILSAVFSVDKGSSLYGFYGRFSNGLIGLLSLGALYFLITNNVNSTSEKPNISVKGLLKAFSWSGFLVVLTSYLAVFGVFAKSAGFLPGFMTSRFFNPVAVFLEGLSIFLAIFLVFLVGKILISARSSIIHYLFLASVLFLMIIVDFTPAWIILMATLAMLVILGLWKRLFRENVNRLLLPIFLIIIAVICIYLQPAKLIFKEDSAVANLPQEQVLDQETSWKIGLYSAIGNVKNGILGSGIGTFNYDFAKEKPLSINEDWLWQLRFDRAGSFFAETLATMGFLGILSYLSLLAVFLVISYFFLRQKSQSLLLLMVLVALIVGQFVFYQNTTLAFLFWLALGLSVVSWQKPIREKIISFKNFPELSLVFSTLVILIGVGFLSLYFFSVKHYLADTNYAAAQELAGGPERVQFLEKAVNLNLRLPQYRASLARAYINEALTEAKKPAAEQDTDQIQLLIANAINQARIAVDLAPNQVAMWETLGVVYREAGSVATGAVDWGIKSFERAIELEPNSPAVYNELGKLYLAIGDDDKAREYFSKSLEKKPNYVNALVQQVLLLEIEGDTAAALERLEELAVDYPLSAEVLFQLGRFYFNNNQVEEAVLQFKKVIILSPNHSNAHYSLGIAYVFQGEIQLAIAEFEKVLELNPGHQDVIEKLEQLR